ncbi:MAG TPA: Hsp20/alpha crystallin family protein [Burkholderiaceae bacterium]|nr:Hsp20/alpha crystallin family protein [Burkholderiaceae bacterium]
MQATHRIVDPATAPGEGPSAEPAIVPAIDVIEDESGITLLADVPGVAKEDLGIRVEADTLTLEAPIRLGEPPQTRAAHAEVRVGRYQRSFTLSRELDPARIEAALSDGVLRLRIPKLEEARPRRIEVRAA